MTHATPAVPATHGTQTGAAVADTTEGAFEPAGHVDQAEAPVVADHELDAHGVGAVRPAAPQNAPAGH